MRLGKYLEVREVSFGDPDFGYSPVCEMQNYYVCCLSYLPHMDRLILHRISNAFVCDNCRGLHSAAESRQIDICVL